MSNKNGNFSTDLVNEIISGKKVTIHIIKNFPPSILNAGEDGRPKTAMFGGVLRDMLSSYNQKYVIRHSRCFNELGPLAIRTRTMPEMVMDKIRDTAGGDEKDNLITDDILLEAARKLTNFGKNNDKKASSDDEESKGKKDLRTSQILFFSPFDIESIASATIQAIKDCKYDAEKFKKMKGETFNTYLADCGASPISVDIAFFGRLVTSLFLCDVESAVQVAPALSTHAAYRENDYFSAIDEMIKKGATGGSGAGMIDNKAFRSSCFYMYSAIDLGTFVENMKNVPDGEKMICAAIEAYIKAFAMDYSSTGQSSYAAQVLPAAVMVEVQSGERLTYSYCNAYEEPVPVYGSSPEVVKNSVSRLAEAVNDRDNAGFDLKIYHRAWWAPKYDESSPENCEKFTSFKDLISSVIDWIKE